ncbi:MAG: SemiSWEET family transporter [Bacteroidota bacterium]
MTDVELLGYGACVVTALTFLPQVIKTWKEKSARNVSLMMFVIAFINEVMWIAYGTLRNDMVIVITNVIMITMCSVMISLKLKYRNA